MESNNSEVEDDPGSGWFQVKKKHRTTSKSSIRGFVGEFSRKVPSSFLQNQSSVNERSGKSCDRQRSHSEARKDFTRNILAHGECSSPDSKEGEKVMSSLDKFITNQDTKPSKSSSAGSISILDTNDKVRNVQVVSVTKNMGAIPKIKWGDLDVDTVLYTENLERVEMIFGNLGDDKLVGHNKSGTAQEFVPQDSSCNERQEEKEAIVLVDGERSPAGVSSVTLTTECCKVLPEISSKYVELLDADEKRANLNDSNIHKINSEHIESVNNLLRDCVDSSNPGNINSLSEGTGTMISPQGHDKSDDGAVDIPEVLVEEEISSTVLDNQDSVFPPVIKSGPEASSNDLVANAVEDFLHGDKARDDFSKAHVANVLEEGESSESKERFRQRLWCFLFENLNRAVDELYLLCELECDLDQMKEAILVLEEAASDFKELISRVEGFENMKGSFFQQSIDGLSMNAKGDHRRPHALSWEVRRMTASPHRAEILSSSLEAFKKIQNERTRIHPVHDKKTLDPAFANNLSNNISEMSGGKDVVEIKTAKSLTKSEQCRVSDLGEGSLIKEKQDMEGSQSSKTYLVQFGSCDSDSNASQVPLRNHPAVFVAGKCKMESLGLASESEKPVTMKKDNMLTEIKAEKNIKSVDHQRKKIASDKEKDKEKRNTVSWKSMDAWKEKRNWEDVLSSPLRPSSRVSHSPGIMRKSVERARVLHDKLMSPEKKKKTALDLKKEAEEKHARAMRIRIELENERVQRLQRTSEKLNRVNEWQAVRNMKLREGMHARHQRSESRHEAYLAEVVRRAGDESSKVNEVRFITSLNEENKKLILRQKLHDSELRRAEKLQMIKSKQKEDMAREEAALERRRLLQAERLRRLAEIQRKKEEAQVRREEERKASSAAREARAMEQVRRQEFRARAQQEEAELLAQKLAERLSESEQRRKIYLEQIRERASMDFRDQSSPSIRRSSNKESLGRSSSVGNVEDCQANNNSVIGACASRISDNAQKQPLKRRIKKVRQRLMALKYEFPEPSVSVEGAGIGYRSMVGTARAKIGRWIQELQRLRQARKDGATSIALIIGDMIKFLEGKEPELHASRQAGLLDFIASALPASHTSRPETCQVIIHLVRLLRIVLSLPANRSYFLAQNLLPPIIPMLSAALENYIKIAASVNSPGSTNFLSSKMSVENFESVSEVLDGFLWIVTSVMGHASIDERQLPMQEGLLELVLAYQVIHQLRDLFALQDRPQAEGSRFPSCIILSLNLLAVLTSRPKTVSAIGWGVFPSEELSANATQESEVVELVDLKNSSFNTTDGDYQFPLSVINANKDEPLSDVPEDRPLDESCRTSRSRDSPSSGFPQKDSADMSVELKCVSSSLQMHATEASCTTQSMIELPLKSYLYRKDVKGSIDIDAGQKNDKIEHPKEPMAFLLSVIVETSLVSLPSLLTAVLLQANSRSSSEQGSYILPSNFEELATGVLKVLNNLALLDLILLQRMLGRPDLKMEFFHLMSFLLSHCSSKWKVATDQVGQLLLESLLLLGYFALFHPGNQAVLRWGKSPTILHKVCDLPFVFFSNPELMPILAGTIVAACYGCEQNRDAVQHELSTEMVLSLLGSCRNGLGSTEFNPSIQDDPTMFLEPNLLGFEPKKSQVDSSGRCNRHNIRNSRSSLAKLGPTGSSTRGSSKIRNQRDSRATKGCETKQNLPGLGSSSTPMLHSRIPSSVIDKLEEVFSTGIVGATKA